MKIRNVKKKKKVFTSGLAQCERELRVSEPVLAIPQIL